MNLYELLEVDRTSPELEEEINANYRRLAKDCHPDKFPNDPERVARFKALTEAFETLSDPDKRKHYDETGEVKDGVVNLHNQSITLLAQALSNVISSYLNADRDPNQYDLLDQVSYQLKSKLTQIKDSLRQLLKNRKLIESLYPRLTTKDGKENLLASVIKAPLKDMERSEKLHNQDMKIVELALEELNNYVFNREQQPSYGFGRYIEQVTGEVTFTPLADMKRINK